MHSLSRDRPRAKGVQAHEDTNALDWSRRARARGRMQPQQQDQRCYVLDNDNDRQARITVSGCLQSAEQGLGSREPNAASRSAEGVNRFVLAPAGTARLHPRTHPRLQLIATGPLYLLEGKREELRTRVGQQIEVTGKPADNDQSANDPNEPDTQRLEVESVRMLAERCSGI